MNNKPKCIIIAGRLGSGKTTLAKKLAERLCLPVVCRDEIKEGFVNTHGVKHDQLPADTNVHVSHLFFALVNQYLAGEVSVVIEAAFQHKTWAANFDKIKERGEPIVVLCSIDCLLAAKRHLQRGLEDPRREYFHGDRRVATFKETGEFLGSGDFEEPSLGVPTIKVATEGEYDPCLDDLVDTIKHLNNPEPLDVGESHPESNQPKSI